MTGHRPVVVALGAVDPTLVTEILGDSEEASARGIAVVITPGAGPRPPPSPPPLGASPMC